MEGEGGVIRIERSAVAVPGVGEVPVPAVVAASGPELATRFLEFFLVAIRDPNTRRAYAAAVRAFCAWLERHGAALLHGYAKLLSSLGFFNAQFSLSR